MAHQSLVIAASLAFPRLGWEDTGEKKTRLYERGDSEREKWRKNSLVSTFRARPISMQMRAGECTY